MDDEPIWAAGRKKPPEWRSGPGRSRFSNPWIELVEYDATAPTGLETHYAVVRFRSRGVGVLPLHEDGTVTLVGQRRFPHANYSWEMPEGGVPFDEDTADGARRELREEAGLTARELIKVLEMELSNSVTDELAICYLALGLEPCAVDPDETEVIEIVRVPFRDLLAAVIAGQIRDSMTVATTLRVHHMAREGELAPELADLLLK
jgi:8-oxo-dGTP pyrophosphatase MutT (NUDIX family)